MEIYIVFLIPDFSEFSVLSSQGKARRRATPALETHLRPRLVPTVLVPNNHARCNHNRILPRRHCILGQEPREHRGSRARRRPEGECRAV